MVKSKVPKRPAFPYCEDVDSLVLRVPTTQKEFVNETVTVEGRLVSRMSVKTVDRVEASKNTNYLDYCLENQIAIGSEGLNNRVVLSSSDIDSFLSGLDSISFGSQSVSSETKSE